MNYTPHYNLNLPEGSDIVNPLVQDNPNYTAIDNAMYANKLRVVGNASEVKTGTSHAITRDDSDISIFKFTATGNWNAGDTATVDGNAVSVFNVDGTALQNNAYVINSEVLCILAGTRLTVYTNKTDVTASDVSADDTNLPITFSNVQEAITELKATVSKRRILANETITIIHDGHVLLACDRGGLIGVGTASSTRGVQEYSAVDPDWTAITVINDNTFTFQNKKNLTSDILVISNAHFSIN